MRFDPSDKQIILACVKGVYFVTYEGQQIKIVAGQWGQTPMQAALCIGFIDNNVITGMFQGELFVWKQNQILTSTKAHQKSVTCLWTIKGQKNEKGVISGSNDGEIIRWDNNLKSCKYNLTDQNLKSIVNFKVRSVCESANEQNVLVGYRGSQIIEIINEKSSNILANGHFEGELWGLAVSPNSNIYYTVGEENLLAMWDITTKKPTYMKLDFPSRQIVVSPDSKYIAVGCLNGHILIIDPKKLKVLTTLKDRQAEVTCIKFSPSSDILAVAFGAPFNEILLYEVKQNFKISEKKLKGSQSKIIHLDFSETGKILQLNNDSNELIYYDLKIGKRLPKGGVDNKDEQWHQWSCVYGWPVQGIWPPCSSGADINAVDRSQKLDILVSCDNFGKVKLFKYPVATGNAGYNAYKGHSNKVTNVKFSGKNDFVISVGGNDKCIFQWKYMFDTDGFEEAEHIQSTMQEEDKKVEEILEEDKDADDIGAVKPFKGEVMNSIPSNYKKSDQDNALPAGNLELKHVFGVSCNEIRNFAKYSSSGKPVYVAAALCVVLEKNNTQTFFQVHEEEIRSLALHPKGQIAATGSIAAKGKSKTIDIYIWDIDTKEILSHINDFHRRAVSYLEFSPIEGSKLLSIGEDDDHSLAIHDWQISQLLCTFKVDKNKITGISWKTDNQFVTVGTRHIKFWSMLGNNLKSKRGIMGQQAGGGFEAITCVTYAFQNSICVTGSSKGTLSVWVSEIIQQQQFKNVHGAGEIGTLLAYKNQLLSGGFDGTVILWHTASSQLQKVQEWFQMAPQVKQNPGIKSLDMKQEGVVLIGVRGCEIYEGKVGSTLTNKMQGHYEGEVWALATCPKNYKFVTAGGDKIIRLWDAQQRKMILASAVFEDEIRALDWDASGKFIVAGDLKAKIHLIEPNALEATHNIVSKLQTASHSKGTAWIQDIKISPNSTLVAFGIHNTASNIEILSVSSTTGFQYKIIILSGFVSALTHLDWSSDSKTIVANSSAYELKFFQITTNNNNKSISAATAKDFEWHTWTCPLGFPTQGIYVYGPDGSNMNSVCRSLNRKCLITGDDFSKVNLFKFPSVIEKSLYKSYIAHSSRVTNVRFTFDDVYAISVGGADRAVCIWETDFGVQDSGAKNEQQQKQEEEEEKVGGEGEEDVKENLFSKAAFVQRKKKKFGPEKYGKDKLGKKIGNIDIEDNFVEEEQKQAEEFLAIKPWVSAIKEPAGYLKPPLRQELPPQIELNLDYIYGYRVKDCRNNLKYLENGNIVYHAASVGIVMQIQHNNQSNSQTFFTLHKDDITAIDMHNDGITIATGELGNNPSVYVWNSNTMQALCHFQGFLSKGIACLSFSLSGDKLAVIGMDDNHEVAIFDVKTLGGTFLSKAQGGRELITAVSWKNDNQFATCGPLNIQFWTISNKTMNSKRGIFWKQSNQILLSVGYNNEECITGTYDGHLQVWNNCAMNNQHKIHDSSVDALYINSNYILTGSSDMTIKILDKTYKVILVYPAQEYLKSSLCPMIQSVYLKKENKNIIIGTFASEIYEIDTKDSKISQNTKFYSPKEILNAHYAPNKNSSNEIWGLAVYQDLDTFATCGDDSTLRIWSSSKKKQIKFAKINLDSSGNKLAVNATTKDINDAARGRALAISIDQKHICIGFKDGHLKVFESDPDPPTQIFNFKCAKDCISCIQYAPSQKLLAVGSHDFAIYLYSVPDYLKKWVMRKHSSYITHLDFSENSVNLQSNCGGYELLFWDCSSGKQLTNGGTALRDEQWATYTCSLGWPVQGIHPVCSDGTDINCVQRSHTKHSGGYSLLATGDDYGQVKILRFPSIKKGSQGVIGMGHSSFVTNVQWSPNDEYLYSTGGEDECIFQWKVIRR